MTASKSQRDRVYLDAFAGQGFGLNRLTGEEFFGSARIALDAEGQHGEAGSLQQRLRADYPARDTRFYEGDCNETIVRALRDLQDVRWAPTFAVLDPDGMELAWETIVALADHKRGYRTGRAGAPEFKTELWMLFPTAGVVRTLPLGGALTQQDERRATRLFGTDLWMRIYQRRASEEISGAEAKDEDVNLMRWRLEQVIGYANTHPFEVKNTRGGTLYHMIFATDHPAGTKIMEHIYSKAAQKVPEMQREARDRGRGQLALDVGITTPSYGYRYERPREP